MKCPHCLENFHDEWFALSPLMKDTDGSWQVTHCVCPSCEKLVVKLGIFDGGGWDWRMVYPKGSSRSPLADSVSSKFAQDYNEAVLVLSDSPKASAALSRRCLQNLLREKGGVKNDDLSGEIQQVLDSRVLPSYLSDGLDAVRNIGAFCSPSNKK